MRWLLSLPLIFLLSGCIGLTSQSHILEKARAEVMARESWGNQAYIRVERKPQEQYIYLRDLTWKVSAGAFDYTDYPNYKGVRVIPGTERELRFSRDGCLVEYEHVTRRCTVGSSTPAYQTPEPPTDK
jgi:hypothetical protein